MLPDWIGASRCFALLQSGRFEALLELGQKPKSMTFQSKDDPMGSEAGMPDIDVSVRQLFGIDSDLKVPAFSQSDEHVPDLDPDYLFNKDVTLAILAGFKHNRRVMVQGFHGTGKSTHIEQIAARLNWPCLRVNLDSHVAVEHGTSV
jgi:cobaltochelatase CobS